MITKQWLENKIMEYVNLNGRTPIKELYKMFNPSDKRETNWELETTIFGLVDLNMLECKYQDGILMVSKGAAR
jgi:hypothetical protein